MLHVVQRRRKAQNSRGPDRLVQKLCTPDQVGEINENAAENNSLLPQLQRRHHLHGRGGHQRRSQGHRDVPKGKTRVFLLPQKAAPECHALSQHGALGFGTYLITIDQIAAGSGFIETRLRG